MNCPKCQQEIIYNHIETCPNCGCKLNPTNWAVVTKEYPPNDLVIESLLKSAGIPVQVTRREVSGFPVAIGPLAEVKILVPSSLAEDAKTIITDFNNNLNQDTQPPKEET